MESAHAPTVAIVGGGLSGLSSARSCLQEGLQPTVFEKADRIGGHWSFTDESSGVFDSLTTNITFYESTFSDVPPLRKKPDDSLGEHASLYLSGPQWREYIDHVISITPGLENCFRTSCHVTSVAKANDVKGSYRIAWLQNGEEKENVFDFVIIANGRHQNLEFIHVQGLSNFPGRIMHSKMYRNPESFKGQNVLVVGGSISGPECAGDLGDTPSGQGPARVMLCTRQLKYFVVKQNAGIAYTDLQQGGVSSFMLRSGISNVLEEVRRLRPAMEETLSRNSDYNLPDPDDSALTIPVNAKFLNAANRGDKLTVKVGEIAEVNKSGMVVFKDGSEEKFDTIIFATGYSLDLPFLDPSLQKKVFAPRGSSIMQVLDLYLYTWHDALPGLAFIGLYYIAGSAMSLLEMQSRWIARAFANPDIMPSEGEMREGVQAWIEKRNNYFPLEFPCELAHVFAEKAGCPVDYSKYPELSKCFLTGPYIPQQFRMFGHGALENWDTVYKDVLEMTGVNIHKMKVKVEDVELLRKCLGGFSRQGRVPNGFENALETLEKELDSKHET